MRFRVDSVSDTRLITCGSTLSSSPQPCSIYRTRTIRIHTRRGPIPSANIATRIDRVIGVQPVVLFHQSEEPFSSRACSPHHRSSPHFGPLRLFVTSRDTPACHAAEAAFWAAAGEHGSSRHLEYTNAQASFATLGIYN